MKCIKQFERAWTYSLKIRYAAYITFLALSSYMYLMHSQTSLNSVRDYQRLIFQTQKLGHVRKLSAYLPENVLDRHNQLVSKHLNTNITKSVSHEDVKAMEPTNRQGSYSFYSQNTSTLYRQNSRRLPKAIIIGVKKCGTRALLEYLRIHPDIKAPGPEPHFFDRYYHMGLAWYREQMPKAYDYQITVEKTPRYFVNSDAPYRIWNLSRSIKLIIVVRNPVTRAVSDFTQGASKQHYLFSSVFERKAFRSNGTGAVNTHWSVINTGLYAQHLRRWLKYFPLSQMYFVSGENLISNPAKELERVQDFLGIKRVINEDNFYFNATKGFPCLKEHERHSQPKCFNSAKGRPHLDLENQTVRKLKTFYEPFNEEFYELTGRDFNW